MVQLLNEYDKNKPFEEYLVNKDWYIKEAKSMIEEIEPSVVQTSMFDMNADYGKRTNFLGQEVVKKKKTISAPIEKKITVQEVTGANRTKLTYDVDSKYALVVSVDLKYSPSVKFYSLSKGTETNFKIRKETFNARKLNVGQIVSLDEFEKKPKWVKDGKGFKEVKGEFVWWLANYKIIETVEDFKRK